MQIRTLVAAIAIAAPGLAIASQCQPDIEKVDAALAGTPSVAVEDLEAAKQLRAEAGALALQGRDLECVVTIGEAMQLLGIAEGD